jgi:hypothetical protein
MPVSLQHQTVLCMGDRFAACSRYQAVPRTAAGAAYRPQVRPWQYATLAAAVVAGAVLAYAVVGNPFTAEPAPGGTLPASATATAVRP